jgi:hypothetical protein
MKFIDLNDDRVYTVADLKNDWEALRAEDQENQAEGFQIELLEILMATINGRNDLEIIGMTPQEVTNYIFRLRDRVLK